MANKVHLRVHLENRVVITTVKAGFANGPLEVRSVHFRNQVNKGFGVAFAASNLSFTFPAVEDKEGCFGDESYAEVSWSRSHVGSKAIWRRQDGGAVAVDTARMVSGCHAGDVDARCVNFRETVQERLSP